MKFGGSCLLDIDHFPILADRIIARYSQSPRIIVVLSALKGMTDKLVCLAKKLQPDPLKRELDMLISVGERISISLLAIALANKGYDVISFTGSQSGIITNCDHNNAKVIDVRPHRLVKELDKKKIVIVAGFQGMSKKGEITTLGRGGADITAIALGISLNVPQVEFYKDVDGIFSSDPKIEKNASLFSVLSYDKALDLVKNGERILHSRCLVLAKKNGIALHVRSFFHFEKKGTVIEKKNRCKKGKKKLYEMKEEHV